MWEGLGKRSWRFETQQVWKSSPMTFSKSA